VSGRPFAFAVSLFPRNRKRTLRIASRHLWLFQEKGESVGKAVKGWGNGESEGASAEEKT